MTGGGDDFLAAPQSDVLVLFHGPYGKLALQQPKIYKFWAACPVGSTCQRRSTWNRRRRPTSMPSWGWGQRDGSRP